MPAALGPRLGQRGFTTASVNRALSGRPWRLVGFRCNTIAAERAVNATGTADLDDLRIMPLTNAQKAALLEHAKVYGGNNSLEDPQALHGSRGSAPVASAAPHRLAEVETALSDKAIYEEIQDCSTVEDVFDIVQDEASSMSLRSAVQALSRIHKLSFALQPAEKAAILTAPAFQNLMAYLQGSIAAMNPVQLCQSLAVSIKLGVPLAKDTLQAYALAADRLAPSFDHARDICTLLHAFAAAKASPGRLVLDKLTFRAQSLLDRGEFRPQGISMLLHACAVLKYKNHYLLKSAVAQAQAQWADFTPQGVANTLWALAKLDHYSYALFEASASHAAQHADSYKPKELFNLLWAWASMRYHPGPALNAVLAYTQSHLRNLYPADLATLMYALGTFAHQPEAPLMGALLPRLEALLPRLSPAELCNVCWGLALTEQTSQPLFARIQAMLPDLYEANALNDSLLRQCFQGLLAAKLEGSPLPPLPPLLLDAMKRAWMTAVHGNDISSSHQEIVDTLKKLKIQHDAKRPTKDGLVSIDVALKPGPSRFVALQLVREHDHTRNTGQSLGSLLLRCRILERNGWEVKTLRMKDYLMVDALMRPLFVAEVLRGLGVRVTLPSAKKPAAQGPAQQQQRGFGGGAAAAKAAAPVMQLFEDGKGPSSSGSSKSATGARRAGGGSSRDGRGGISNSSSSSNGSMTVGSLLGGGSSKVSETELMMQTVVAPRAADGGNRRGGAPSTLRGARRRR